MLRQLKPKSEFSRHVLTLMTGTTIAQAIPIAISPILTRIYTPEDFGVFALYMSITSILSVLATGRYELAIMLPKKDDDALNIMILSIIISFFVSCFLFIIVFVFNDQITYFLGNPKISNWLYFIPMTVLLTGIYQSVNYWSNRKKQYQRLAINKILKSGTTATTNLGMGLSGVGSSGLILSQLIGQSIATVMLCTVIWKEDKNWLKKVKKLKIFALVKKYIKFPKYDVGASLLNILAHQLPNIFFNIIFNSSVSGYYYLTQRILGLPISILGSAILTVFREQASIDYKKFGNAKKIYIQTFKKLFIIGFFTFILLYFFSVELFVLVFGDKWNIAGEYAKILTPLFFLKFISNPLSFMLYIGEKQKLNLYSQFLFIIALLYSFLVSSNIYEVLHNITIFFCLIYIYYLYLSAKIAKVF